MNVELPSRYDFFYSCSHPHVNLYFACFSCMTFQVFNGCLLLDTFFFYGHIGCSLKGSKPNMAHAAEWYECYWMLRTHHDNNSISLKKKTVSAGQLNVHSLIPQFIFTVQLGSSTLQFYFTLHLRSASLKVNSFYSSTSGPTLRINLTFWFYRSNFQVVWTH